MAETSAVRAFLPSPPELIPLNSIKGKELLAHSDSEAFLPLAQFYITQPDLGSCSVASCTMILNALPIERPVSKPHGDFHLFTPSNFFTPKVSAIRSREQVSASGMSLEELSKILSTFPIDVKTTYAKPGAVKIFRELIISSLSRPNEYILVNYLRKSLGQETGGHISPIGAYNRDEHYVLILDVSNYKYPWIWIKLETLYNAMLTIDQSSSFSRGYILVKTKPN